jgi:hypothetical protein
MCLELKDAGENAVAIQASVRAHTQVILQSVQIATIQPSQGMPSTATNASVMRIGTSQNLTHIIGEIRMNRCQTNDLEVLETSENFEVLDTGNLPISGPGYQADAAILCFCFSKVS